MAGSQKVTIEVDAATARFLADWKTMQAQVDRLGQAGGRAAEKFKKGGKGAAEGFNKAAQSAFKAAAAVTGIGTAFQAITTAIAIIRAEAERLKRVGETVDQTRLTREQALSSAMTAFGGDISAGRLSRIAKTTQGPTRLKQATIFATLRDLAGASGGLLGGPEELAEFVRVTAEAFPEMTLENQDETFRTLAGAITGIAKSQKLIGRDISADQSAAAFLRLFRKSPSIKPEQFGATLPGFLTDVMVKTGGQDTLSDVGTLFTVLAQAGGDAPGRRTATNISTMISNQRALIAQLAPELKGLSMEEQRLRLRDAERGTKAFEVRRRFLGALDPRALQEDLFDEKGKFLQPQLGGEIRTQAILAQSLVAGSAIDRAITQARQDVGDVIGKEAIGELRARGIERQGEEFAAMQDARMANVAKDRAADANLSKAVRERILKVLESRTEFGSTDAIDSFFNRFADSLRRNFADAEDPTVMGKEAVKSLRDQIQNIEQMKTADEFVRPRRRGLPGMMGGGVEFEKVQPTDAQRQQMQKQIEMLDVMADRIVEQLKLNNEQQKQDAADFRNTMREQPVRNPDPRPHPANALNE